MGNLSFDQWFPTMIGVNYYEGHNNVAEACIAQALTVKETAEKADLTGSQIHLILLTAVIM